MRISIFAAALLALSSPAFAQPPAQGAAYPVTTPAVSDADDPFIWLEDAESPKAIAWAEAENARTFAVLQGDPRYETLHAQALKIATASDRIPTPGFRAGAIYNLWQDEAHVQGLWRRTTLASYRAAAPAWETVLDLDALAKADGKTWVWKGAVCLNPAERLCILNLSDGGEDAVELREFDLKTKAFVPGGFHLPRGKQDAAWLDSTTLLVSRDWGPGTMTQSGYAFVVKTLIRGQALDQAREVFRGEPTDVGVSPLTLHDGQGHKMVLIERSKDFFHTEHWLLVRGVPVRLNLPERSTVQGLLHGHLIMTLEEDWTAGPTTYAAGSLIAVDPKNVAPGGTPASRAATLIFQPGPRQSVEQVAVAKDRVVAAIYDNVRGRAIAFESLGGDGWRATTLPGPRTAAVSLVSADDRSDLVFVQTANFLSPPALSLIDAANGTAATLKQLPARFDASGDVTEQFEATSKDGTKIPYFVVRPRDLKYDGTAPTLLYAYGGFQISETPRYSGAVGKLWLERGGVYVLANIRGGGEFGPAWHEAGLKTQRQRVYDDFAAVAEDLIARKITSPRRLGIEGGSNGGLLMGVQMEQRPDLWNAVVIQVPLLDMLRITKIGAGASWVGEYGSPDIPQERAFLASISPYHNLKPGVAYPEPLIVTSTKDDRVGPGHARKFAARMAAMGLPFLYYENTEGGHSAAANQREIARKTALEMTYLTRKLMD
jgi:prolyl oligopeptidase